MLDLFNSCGNGRHHLDGSQRNSKNSYSSHFDMVSHCASKTLLKLNTIIGLMIIDMRPHLIANLCGTIE